jgi:hypothetical protein
LEGYYSKGTLVDISQNNVIIAFFFANNSDADAIFQDEKIPRFLF